MFYWFIAIPFFVALAMFTLYPRPGAEIGMKALEDTSVDAAAFRMAMQHDAMVKATKAHLKDNTKYTWVRDGAGTVSSDLSVVSALLPSGFQNDSADSFESIIYCMSATDQDGVTSPQPACKDAAFVYVFTHPVINASNRWYGEGEAAVLADKISKYKGIMSGAAYGVVKETAPAPDANKNPVGSKRGMIREGVLGANAIMYDYLPSAFSCRRGDLKGRIVLMSQVKGSGTFPLPTTRCPNYLNYSIAAAACPYTTNQVIFASNKSGKLNISCAGRYTIEIAGGAGKDYADVKGNGGLLRINNRTLAKDTKITFSTKSGYTKKPSKPGSAMGLTIDGKLIAVAGGGGAYYSGGGGYHGGCGTDGNGQGFVADCVSVTSGATGGKAEASGISGAYGGSGYCNTAEGYTCTQSYNSNAAPEPYIKVTYLGS